MAGDQHRRRRHEHLWVLTDGTPAHAPPGRLTVHDDGKLACHLCGNWFAHLGAHLRAHGYTAPQYREAVGLPRGRALGAADLSATASARQATRYRKDARIRERLAPGQRLARSGELTRAALAAADLRRAAGRTPIQEVAHRREALSSGRQTVTRGRDAARAELLRSRGFADLATLLRADYAAGASLEQLAATTGLGRARLRTEVDAAGIQTRAPGQNRPESLAANATRTDAEVAQRLGLDPAELHDWLRAQRQAGITLAALARATGRSDACVRSRINNTVTRSSTSRRTSSRPLPQGRSTSSRASA